MNMVAPKREKNAIAVVAFAFELAPDISEGSIQKIIDDPDDSHFNDFFPIKQKIEATTLQFVHDPSHSAAATAPVQKTELQGVRFLTDNQDDADWVLDIRKSAVVVLCRNYTTWTAVFGRVQGFISELSSILENATVSGVTLEYLDEFLIEDENRAGWQTELFSKSANLFPHSVFNYKAPWYSHNSYFSKTQNGMSDVLTNYIIALLNPDPEMNGNTCTVEIKTSHRIVIEQDMPITLTDFVDNNQIGLLYNEMHQLNKIMLANILSSEMKKTINLEV